MSLLTSLDISASGLTAQRRRFEVAQSNQVNADTMKTAEGGPYRRKDVVFQTTTFGSAFQAANDRSEGVEVAGIVDDMTPFEVRHDPGNPYADPETGNVSYPNVNMLQETMNMISASRGYESNISVITIVKAMITRTLEIGK